MGQRGTNGKTNAAIGARSDSPEGWAAEPPQLGPGTTLPGARRTLVFPSSDAIETEVFQRSGAPRPDSTTHRAPTVRPPPPLELSLQDNGVPEGVRSRAASMAPPVVRWTTPNRRPASPRAVERAARSSERYLQDPPDLPPTASIPRPAIPPSALAAMSRPPPLPITPMRGPRGQGGATTEELSSSHLLDAGDAVPADRPSDRSTVPIGVLSAPSAANIVELVPSELLGDVKIPPPPPLPGAGRHANGIRNTLPASGITPPRPQATAAEPAPISSSAPPISIPATRSPRPNRRRYHRALVPILASHVALAVLAIFIAGRKTEAPEPREARVGIRDRSPLAFVVGVPLPSPPSGGCTPSGASRMLAPRAHIGAGLDLAVLDTGFGVGLASGASEATGIRIEGTGLHVAETVRVKAPSAVSHVTVDQGHEDDNDGLDVRVDSDEARTVIGGEGPAFRVATRGGSIVAFPEGVHESRARTLWATPGTLALAHPVRNVHRRPAVPASSLAAATLRVAGRDDGGAVVAVRRSAAFWLGVVDSSLAPAGPLASIARTGATVGNPSVAQWGGGGVVAWAEKPIGEREWKVVVAGFTPDGEGATTVGVVREIGHGMSPTIAALPDGDLLLAYADGRSGAHRVLAQRLTNQLQARGAAIVVSPETVNAGQPVAAVRADGRAMIAFFAADRGRLGSVHATPLVCDPGL